MAGWGSGRDRIHQISLNKCPKTCTSPSLPSLAETPWEVRSGQVAHSEALAETGGGGELSFRGWFIPVGFCYSYYL